MSAARTCACGCDQPIPDDHRAHARYLRGHRPHRAAGDLAAERVALKFWADMADLTTRTRKTVSPGPRNAPERALGPEDRVLVLDATPSPG